MQKLIYTATAKSSRIISYRHWFSFVIALSCLLGCQQSGGEQTSTKQLASFDLREHKLIKGLSQDGTVLDLSGTDVSDEELGQLSLGIFGDVKLLLLRNTGVTDKGLNYIAKLPLEVLDLTATEITDIGLMALKNLNLKRLLLIDTKVTDAGLFHLSNIPLEWILLNNTAITDAGIVYLKTQPLKAINLNGTKVSDASIAQLKDLSLERIDIEGTKISKNGIAFIIKNFNQLKVLNITSDVFTPEEKNYLKENKGDLKIGIAQVASK